MERCNIFQQQRGKLHQVKSIRIGQRHAENLPDQLFYLRMDSIPKSVDAIAYDN